jgi:hypothetical protein
MEDGVVDVIFVVLYLLHLCFCVECVSGDDGITVVFLCIVVDFIEEVFSFYLVYGWGGGWMPFG